MQKIKHGETAILIYFGLLLLLVLASIGTSNYIVNLVYVIVILSCSLKLILIVNKDKK